MSNRIQDAWSLVVSVDHLGVTLWKHTGSEVETMSFKMF